jgi:hypothetical protein
MSLDQQVVKFRQLFANATIPILVSRFLILKIILIIVIISIGILWF